MALLKNITLPSGTNLSFKYTDFVSCFKSKEEVLESSYIKIDVVTSNKELCSIDVGIYDSKNGTRLIIKQYNFIPNIKDGCDNFIKQGYDYLKTLDEYKDATDLLDEGQTR